MANFQTLVEQYTGSVSTILSSVSEWLTISARKILNTLPEHILNRYASKLTIANNTTNLAEYRLLNVLLGDRVCKEITFSEEVSARDSGSSKYATAYSPVFILKDGVVRIYPWQSVPAILRPRVGVIDFEILDGGFFYTEGTMLKLQDCQGTQAAFTVTAVDGMGTITNGEITTAGDMYSIISTAFTIVTPDSGEIGVDQPGDGAIINALTFKISSIDVLSGGGGYSAENTTITIAGDGSGAAGTANINVADGSISSITMTNNGTGYSHNNNTASAASDGYAYVIAYPTVTYSATSITDFPPTLYSAVVLNTAIYVLTYKIITAFNSLSDIAFAAITPPDALGITLSMSGLTVPTFTAPSMSDTLTATTTGALDKITAALNTDEDIELANGQINRANLAINKYQAELQSAIASFNRSVAEFNAQVEVLKVKQTDASLAIYQTKVQVYAQDINAEATRINSLIQKSSGASQGYMAMIPLLKAEYQEIIQSYIQ